MLQFSDRIQKVPLFIKEQKGKWILSTASSSSPVQVTKYRQSSNRFSSNAHPSSPPSVRALSRSSHMIRLPSPRTGQKKKYV